MKRQPYLKYTLPGRPGGRVDLNLEIDSRPGESASDEQEVRPKAAKEDRRDRNSGFKRPPKILFKRTEDRLKDLGPADCYWQNVLRYFGFSSYFSNNSG